MKMLSRNVTWMIPGELEPKIQQVYQSGLEYAFVSKDMKQCAPFVWCKEFLHDMLFSQHNSNKFSLYHFKFDPANGPLVGLDKTRIIIANSSDPDLGSKMEAVLDFLHQLEDAIGFTRSRIRNCLNPPQNYSSGVFLFEGSHRWMSAPPLISLYTLAIRIGCVHTVGKNFMETMTKVAKKQGGITPYQNSDQTQMESALPGIRRIINEKPQKIFYRQSVKNFPSGQMQETIHHYFGICAFASNSTKKLVPRWHVSNKKPKVAKVAPAKKKVESQ